VLGKNLVEFSVRATGLRSDKFQVNGYDRKAQQLVSSTKTISSGVNQPDSDLAASFKQPGDNLNGTAELLTTDVGAQSVDETALIASALSNQAVAAGVSAVGVVLDGTALMPGEKVKVVDAGPTSGHYHVTKVEHVYRDEFRTRIFSGERRPLSLVDTLSGAQGSAVAAPLRHYGLVVGKVTNINDDEKSGRVKVTYPGVSPLQETSWARVLCLGAGPKRGAVVLPRVDDEVLIGFEGGDINQPVVLGGLYGSKSTIPLWDVDGSGTLKETLLTTMPSRRTRWSQVVSIRP